MQHLFEIGDRHRLGSTGLHSLARQVGSVSDGTGAAPRRVFRRIALLGLAFVTVFAARAEADLEIYSPPHTAPVTELQEPPDLAQKVAAGVLPPVDERVPAEPLIVRSDKAGRLGQPGG